MCRFPGDQPGFLRVDLFPGDSGWGKAIPCPECHSEKMAKRINDNQLQGQLKAYTFENYIPQDDSQRIALDSAMEFSANPVGFLTIHGANGPGKTHLLAAIANKLGLGKSRYFTLPDLVARLKSEIGSGDPEKVIRDYSNINVLIIDEIDKAFFFNRDGRPNWAYEQVFRLIESRYRYINERGTALASNMSPSELNDRFSYLVSRASDDRCKIVYIGNKDNRGIVSKLRKLISLGYRD